MNTGIYAQLAVIQAKRKRLEERENALKAEILQDMAEGDQTSIVNTYGKYTMAFRQTYKYSDKITSMVEKVKLAKLKEEKNGTAVMNQKGYLVFTPNKEHEA